MRPLNHALARATGKLLLPLLVLFGLHLALTPTGAAGGIGAGVALAAAGAAHALVFGARASQQAIAPAFLRGAALTGAGLVVGGGFMGLVSGGGYLDHAGYGPLGARFGAGVVEVGLMALAFAVPTLTFQLIAGRAGLLTADPP